MKDDDKQKIFDTLRAMNERQSMIGRMQEYSHSCVLLALLLRQEGLQDRRHQLEMLMMLIM